MKNIFYNVTYNVDETVVEDWKKWMKESYIPQLVTTDYFISIKMLKILVEEEMGGQSFAVMYKCANLDVLEAFMENYSAELNKIMSEKFGQKVVSFMTLLEEEFSI